MHLPVQQHLKCVKAEVRQVLKRGVQALSALSQFTPWIAGEQFNDGRYLRLLRQQHCE